MQRRKSTHATPPYSLRGRVLMMMSPAPADKGTIAAGAAPEKWSDLMYGLPSMGTLVQGLSEDDMKDIAAYYEAQKRY